MKKSFCFFLLACAFGTTASAAPPGTLVSTEKDRSKVSITIYNQNFGLVRELRTLSGLPNGTVALEYADVASTIQPETVHVRSTSGPNSLAVLEQNYRYDLLSPQKLLEKYVGRPVRLYRYHEAKAQEEAVDARLLSVEGGPVVQIGNEVTANYPGRFAFPNVPDDLIARPTLVWLLESRAPKQSVEVSYVAQQLNWNADYVLNLEEKETNADLLGWVTLVNQSGTTYENAELKLVAGDVNRAPARQTRIATSSSVQMAKEASFRSEGLFEYHLYTLARPTTLRHNEQKQVTLLEGKGVGVRKKLILPTSGHYYRQAMSGSTEQKVGVHLEFDNTEKNRLGMPLPRGTVRVYKADKSGAKQFVGEDAINHTPRDETIKIKIGDAFDVLGERKQMKWTALGTCSSESSWELEIRNRKDEPVVVEALENTSGDWTITSSTLPAERKDAFTFNFKIPVPARGKTKVSYVIRVRWC